MIKKLILFCTLALSTKFLIAQSTQTADNAENSFVLWLTLTIAIVALVLSILNYLRISYIRKVSEVGMINQKDDLNMTIEAVKVGLSKEIRYLRKEVSKTQKVTRPNNTAAPMQVKTDDDSEDLISNNTEPAKKPFKKRPSNFRRRPPHKNQSDKKPDSEE